MLREAPRARGRAVLGVRELFSTLRSGNPIVGIATSSKADELRQYDEHSIPEFADGVARGERECRGNPSPNLHYAALG